MVQQSSRRVILAGLAAAPLAGASAGADTTGSVRRLTAAHRAAWKAFDEAVGVLSLAEQSGDDARYAAAEAAWEQANDREVEALRELCEAPCATFEQVQAKAAYLIEAAGFYECLDGETVIAVLQSFLPVGRDTGEA